MVRGIGSIPSCLATNSGSDTRSEIWSLMVRFVAGLLGVGASSGC